MTNFTPFTLSIRKSLMALAIMSASFIFAANTTQTVSQVTSAVSLTTAVDYHITSTTPFATAGSIDIQNPDAVVIIDNIKPSVVLAKHLSYIYINGEAAINGENCQVRMYNTGAIILPHGKDFKPLTVYSEQNFEGTAVNDFGLEHNNGYMNTLSNAKLNNAIRSFKLKRGYMVTFSIGANGRGYSRCFIADKEDLEFATLPTVLDKRISSYRIFKWLDAQKKGLANDTGYESTQKLNVSWCYSFGPGEDRGIDTECVPHKIQINWPGNCGTITYSAHLKTNNEPGNEADHGVEDLDDVLATWEDLMATGKRLCSPSSHDGSLNWMRNFMDSIDARGWRCDIIDMHCYWPEWNLNNALKDWYDSYKRPIWISEFVWGASWNNNGIFATDRSYSTANQQKNYDVMSKVLTNWNNTGYIERYAYWNSEADCSKILKDGNLSILGKFYAEMNSNLAYNKDYEYVPKVVYKSPSNLTLTYATAKKIATLQWNNPNGELTDSIWIERKVDNESNGFVPIKTITYTEPTSMSVKDTLTDKTGAITYRIRHFDSDKKQRVTGEVDITIGSATGNSMIQYGNLTIANTNEIQTDYTVEFEEAPAVFMGLITYKNTNVHPTNFITSASKRNFKYKIFPLQNQGTTEITKDEDIPFMALKLGNYTFGNMDIEIDSARVKSDTTIVKFVKPFPEGVTPVVITELKPSTKTRPFFTKIWDITNEGFKATAFYEAAENATVRLAQPFFYAAFTPGSECIDEEKGIIISAGVSTSPLWGSSARLSYFTNESDTMMFKEPLVFATLQTYNYGTGTILRKSTDITTDIDGEEYISGARIRKYTDSTVEDKPSNNSASADYAGWVAITSEPVLSTGIEEVITVESENPIEVEVINRCIYVKNCTDFEVFTLSGVKVAPNATQEPGIYLVRSGKQTAKVVVN